MAVQRKIFMRSMMRNKIPRAIANHRSHGGRIPSSQIGEITKSKNVLLILVLYLKNKFYSLILLGELGSNTNTVVAANNIPSLLSPNARDPLLVELPVQSISVLHPPAH